jgi:hypothetical protein
MKSKISNVRIAKYSAVALAISVLFSTTASSSVSSWDNGRVWSKLNTSLETQFNGIAESGNGQIVYLINGDGVQFSSDSGITWETRNNGISDIPGYLTDIATSSDGAKVVAVANGFHVWRSTDFGANWMVVQNIRGAPLNTDSVAGYRRVSSSTSGQYISIMDNEGYVLTSNDFGVNFTRRVVSSEVYGGYFADIEISGDGQKIIVPTDIRLGKIFISTDYGVSFQAFTNLPVKAWTTVEISGDGNTLVAAAMGDNIWTSRDSGSTWNMSVFGLAPRYKSWSSASISYNGEMIGVTRNGYTVVTTSSGGSGWEIRSGGASDADYQAISASSDGLIMFVTAKRDGVYRSLPSWITTDAGTVTFMGGCGTEYTGRDTSVQAQSVVLIIDTLTVANDLSTYYYFTETNTALWGATYDYGQIMNVDCSYSSMSGNVTIARGPFIASSGSQYSETSTLGLNADFVQYVGNIIDSTGFSYTDNNCGNLTVPHLNVANSCNFDPTWGQQSEWPILSTGGLITWRDNYFTSATAPIKTGNVTTSKHPGVTFVIVKALKSRVDAAPKNTSWVSTETFTVTTA